MCEKDVDYCSTIDTEEIQVKHDLPYVSAAVGIVTASDESDFCRVKALEDSTWGTNCSHKRCSGPAVTRCDTYWYSPVIWDTG